MISSSKDSWPKPSILPICSLVLLLINGLLLYGLDSTQASFYWAGPTSIMNIFFFWAEWSIYMRDKRNFDGWRHEMEILLRPAVKNVWNDRINAVRPMKRKQDQP